MSTRGIEDLLRRFLSGKSPFLISSLIGSLLCSLPRRRAVHKSKWNRQNQQNNDKRCSSDTHANLRSTRLTGGSLVMPAWKAFGGAPSPEPPEPVKSRRYWLDPSLFVIEHSTLLSTSRLLHQHLHPFCFSFLARLSYPN